MNDDSGYQYYRKPSEEKFIILNVDERPSEEKQFYGPETSPIIVILEVKDYGAIVLTRRGEEMMMSIFTDWEIFLD